LSHCSGPAEGAEAKAGVESGFAHRAITGEEARSELIAIGRGLQAITHATGSACGFGEIDVIQWSRMGEQIVDDVDVVRTVVGHLRHGALAEIEVAGELRVPSEMRWRDPEIVSADEIRDGLVQEASCGFGVLLEKGFVDGQDHRGEERWL